ncbi:MAG: DNA polymerase III subunit gamma/tau [Candidatus Bipolaricaulota bacterium]
MNDAAGHLSLYRRWRPQRFGDVVGQDDVVRTLRNALSSGEVSHAYLFAGERGIGKTSVARILARAVNCLNPEAGEPCNRCSNCGTILSGRSLDIAEIDGASNRGIDHIRKLREDVAFAPTDLKRKVYIIDEVHMLTTEAFNALLKTLEEPPPHVMFIFATTEPHKLPRTIVSRCQAFEFRRLTSDRIAAHLGRIASAESISLTPEAQHLIAERANGGLRDAVVMLEQAAAYGQGEIGAAAVLDMLGLAARATHEEFLAALESGDRPALVSLVSDLAERGKDLETFLGDSIDLLRTRIAADPAHAETSIDLARGLLTIKADLFRTLDRRIRFEIGTLALAASRPAHTSKSSPSPRPAAPLVSPVAPQPSPAASERRSDPLPETLASTWRGLMAEVEQDRIAVAAYLTEAAPHLDGERLVLSFHPEHTFHKESLEKVENLHYLAGAVRRHFGDSVRVDIRFDASVERKPLPREILLEKARLVCETFGGQILKEEL